MTDRTESNERVDNAPVIGGAVPLESILCTDELLRRPSRPPDFEKESRALIALAEALDDSPDTILQKLVDTMLVLFEAGSTGISLLTKDGGKRFYWPAIAGEWKQHIGGGTPRDFGPCGTVLDLDKPLLFQHIERRFTYFAPVTPAVEEALLVPFYVHGKAEGTIWAVAHNERKFDAEDERLMRSLGKFASSAYQILESRAALKVQATDREKAESSLRDFIETVPIPLHWVGPDGVILWANQAELDTLGYSKDEYIGQHIAKFHADQPVISDIMERLLQGETLHDYEARLRCSDGSIRNVLIDSSGFFENGKFVHTRCVTRDVTGQKVAERAKGLLAAIVDSSDDAVVSKRLDGTITSWNRSAERIFGYRADQAVGQHINLIIPPDRRNEEADIISRLKNGERIDHFETVRRHRNGTLFDISVTISPVKDGRGKVIGASKVARDISERKQVERSLHETKEELRKLADSLESQVELRTRELNQRNAEVLEQTAELRELSRRLLETQDEERRRIARDLHDSAGQIVTALGMTLGGIVHQAVKPEVREAALEGQEMLKQLNMEIRTVSYLLHPPLLDEMGLLEAIRWYTGGLTERSGLKIESSIPEDFGRLPSEVETALFRILQECLTNIHRHSGSKTATVRLARDLKTVKLEIQDAGAGMSPEKLAAIRSERSGVGITGMRERVRHLNGKLDIQSNSSGTTVSVNFPLSENKNRSQEAAD